MKIIHSTNVSIAAIETAVHAENGVVKVNSVTRKAFAARRELSGESCPGYKIKIATGQSATTPMSAMDTRVKAFRSATSYKLYTVGTPDVFSNTRRLTGVGAIPVVSTQPDLVKIARQTLSSKFYGLYETGPQTDIGIIAVELSETVQMLTNPFKHLVKEVSKRYSQSGRIADRIIRSPALRKLPKQKRKIEARKQWNNAYLEAYFGWFPFISEIEGIMTDLEALVSKPPLVQVRVAGSSDKLSSLEAVDGFVGVTGKTTVQSHHRHSISVRGAYPVSLSLDTEIPKLGKSSTAVDVYPALWEAIPYSWLADYVFNVGSVLSADQSAATLNWAWLSETSHYKRTDTVVTQLLDSQPSRFVRVFDSRPGLLVVEHKRISRSVPSAISPPEFGWRHKPQTRIAALAAVASVADMRRQDLKRRKSLAELFNNL